MHKVRMVQKLHLLPVEERLRRIQEAGNNTFLLQNKDIYLYMLTDSGVNAMSDLQFAAMMQADDAYAGCETFNRVKAAVKEVFGCDNVLPAHQGRACENILAEAYVKPGMVADGHACQVQPALPADAERYQAKRDRLENQSASFLLTELITQQQLQRLR